MTNQPDIPFATGGLQADYKRYVRQQCFVGLSHSAAWRDDIVAACAEALPAFGLEPWYADEHLAPTKTLRDKVVQAIANARCGIYDLSSWQDQRGEWRLPRNVLIELGMAIALNRPAVLLRHTSNQRLPLPECLRNLDVIEFHGDTNLKRAFRERLPGWIDRPPEQDWLNRFCAFGQRSCDFREQHPRLRQWGRAELPCHVADGLSSAHPAYQPAEREEIRAAIEDVFGRYTQLKLQYLDELSPAEGYRFLLCGCCQAVRAMPLAVYRLTSETPAEVFITIGISIALETLFLQEIPKVLLVRDEADLPSLLRAYDAVVAPNSSSIKRKLAAMIPDVVQQVRAAAWTPRLIPFIDLARQIDQHPPAPPEQAAEPSATLDALVDALLDCRAVRDSSSRDALLSQLPTEIRAQVADDPTPRGHIQNIMRTCARFPNGLDEFIAALRYFEGDSLAMREVERVLAGVPTDQLYAVAGQLAAVGEDQQPAKITELQPLVTALLDCSTLHNGAMRELIVQQLPSAIGNAIPRSRILLDDVREIVRACLKVPGGIQELIEIVRFFEGDSVQMQEVDALIAQMPIMQQNRVPAERVTGIPRAVRELVIALLECQSVQNRSGLDAIVHQLRLDISRAISENPMRLAYVFNIVITCMAFQDGLQELIAIVALFEADTPEIARVRAAAAPLLHSPQRDQDAPAGVNRFHSLLRGATDLTGLLDQALQELEAITRTDYNQIFLAWRTVGGVELIAVADAIAAHKDGYQVASRTGVIGQAYASGVTVNAPDVNILPNYIAAVPETLSELAVPIANAGEVLGVLNSESEEFAHYGRMMDREVEQLAAALGQLLPVFGWNADQSAEPGLIRRRPRLAERSSDPG